MAKKFNNEEWRESMGPGSWIVLRLQVTEAKLRVAQIIVSPKREISEAIRQTDVGKVEGNRKGYLAIAIFLLLAKRAALLREASSDEGLLVVRTHLRPSWVTTLVELTQKSGSKPSTWLETAFGFNKAANGSWTNWLDKIVNITGRPGKAIRRAKTQQGSSDHEAQAACVYLQVSQLPPRAITIVLKDSELDLRVEDFKSELADVGETDPTKLLEWAKQIERDDQHWHPIIESSVEPPSSSNEEEHLFIETNVNSDDQTKFESAHKHLGTMLGFSTGTGEFPGSPDLWWVLNEGLCLAFADHASVKATSSLDRAKARQVSSYPYWIRENVPAAKNANVLPVLITPLKTAEKKAFPHLKGVYLWRLDEFRSWVKSALDVIRDLRRAFPGSGYLVWRTNAAEKLQAAQLDPASINTMLVFCPAQKVLTTK